MNIVFVSQNPFGVQGTPGTYKLVDAFSKKANVVVFSNKFNNLNAKIVYDNKKDFPVYEVDYRNKNEFLKIHEKIIKAKPDIIYFCSGQVWRYDEGYLIKKLKEYDPSLKFILDIKSPPLIDDCVKARKFKECNNAYQDYFDLILSRSIKDIEDWFGEIRSSVLIYPLGVSFEDALCSIENQKNISCKKFIYIGAIHKRRQIHALLECVGCLPSYIKEVFRLDLYGSGPYFDEAMSFILNNNLSNCVKLFGSISHRDILKKLRKYDVGVGWVPYEGYDYAPSIKSLEYMASGLVPLLSDTLAHQRLLDLGLDIEFFSNNRSSFVATVEKLCTSGFSAISLAKNADILKSYDWESVVDNYIFPEVEKVFRKKSEVFSNDEKVVPLSHYKSTSKRKKIFFLFSSQCVYDFLIRKIIKEVSRLGHDIYIDFVDMYDKDGSPLPDSEPICSLFDNIVHFSPDIVVILYQEINFLDIVKKIFRLGIPLLLSERVIPQRIEANTLSYYDKTLNENIALNREILICYASIFHVRNEFCAKSILPFFKYKVVIFNDNAEKAINTSSAQIFEVAVMEWMCLFDSLETNKPQKKIFFADDFEHEKYLHLKRMMLL